MTAYDLPPGFLEWSSLAQATALALLTFVQEDVPLIAAALLAGAGSLSWSTAFWGCFLGIWIGDALLYAAGRLVGRRILGWRWTWRFLKPEAVERGERWFARRGSWALVASRFVPGTRLPTYLAAGLLRQPVGRFLWVTGLTVSVWTAGWIFLAGPVGGGFSAAGELPGWPLFFAVVLGMALVVPRAIQYSAQRGKSDMTAHPDGTRVPEYRQRFTFWTRLGIWVTRWTKPEFWPPWLFYPPVVLYCLWLAVRHRGLNVPAAANPGMFTGGLVGESKLATLEELAHASPAFTPETFPIEGGALEERLQSVQAIQTSKGVAYPFVVKPDVGQRGAGVKVVRHPAQLTACLSASPEARLLLQHYCPGPFEAGIFYYRFPNEPRGHILGITEKIFPLLIGDGRRTVEELIWADARARFMARVYLRRFESRRREVLPEGGRLSLVEAGNHAQGCIFKDGGRLWSEALEARIDDISRGLTGFYIGRYDVRYTSEADLRSGRAFQIIELNGAAAESTQVYDPAMSLKAVYSTLFRQWALVFAIGAANRARGFRPLGLGRIILAWRQYLKQSAGYPAAD